MELLIFYFSVEHGGMGTLIVDIVMVGLFSIFFNQSLGDSSQFENFDYDRAFSYLARHLLYSSLFL